MQLINALMCFDEFMKSWGGTCISFLDELYWVTYVYIANFFGQAKLVEYECDLTLWQVPIYNLFKE